MQVLQHDQPGGVVQVGERVRQVLHQQPPPSVPVALPAPRFAQPFGQHRTRGPRRVVAGPAQVAGQVQQHPARVLLVPGEGRGAQHREAEPLGAAGHRTQQAALADPGLAGHEEQVPAAGGGLLEPPPGEGEQLVATDQDGGGHHVTSGHVTSSPSP